MIYTSYFANIKNLDGICYAVSRLIPSFYNDLMKQNANIYKRYIDFAPKKYWWKQWKSGKFNNDQFARLYKETVLDKINIINVLNQFNKYKQDIFLLCYQKPNDFCHRHLIRQWLNLNSIKCKQFKQEKQQLEMF